MTLNFNQKIRLVFTTMLVNQKNKNEYFYVAEFTKEDVLMRLAVNNNGYRYGVIGKKEEMVSFSRISIKRIEGR